MLFWNAALLPTGTDRTISAPAVCKGWFTLVRPSGPVWAFGPGYRTAGRHGKSWASRPARRLSRPSSVRPLPLVRMACRAGNHCNLVAGMRAFWRLSFTVVLTRIWTRIEANGRPFPSATPSSPSFSDTRAIFRSDIPDICRPISMDTGVTIWKWKHWWKRWRMISKQPKMILSMQLSEVQCGDFMLTQKLPVCSYSRNRSLFLRIYQIVT